MTWRKRHFQNEMVKLIHIYTPIIFVIIFYDYISRQSVILLRFMMLFQVFFIFILSLPVFKMCLTFTFHKKNIYNLNIISVGYKWHPKHIITQDTESSVARKSKEISKLVCTHVRNTVGLVCLWMSNNPTSNRSICTVVN